MTHWMDRLGLPGLDTLDLDGLPVARMRNGGCLALDEVPRLSPADFHAACVEARARGARLSAMFVLPGDERERTVAAVLAHDATSQLGVVAMVLGGARSYPSLTAEIPQAHPFERELFERYGLRPEGHPWLKPLRRNLALEDAPPARAPRREAFADFHRTAGDGVHEVAVGPVHAGVIEPGHFRFQCRGERVMHLEIRLGYQHRGAEALLRDAAPVRRLAVAESIAGDTAIGHSLAHCALREALAGVEPPLEAQRLRGVGLELERIANHVGDLGALCGDIGFLPGSAWFGRMRGDFLNMLMLISGNRFGRGLVKPGGVRFAVPETLAGFILPLLNRLEDELSEVSEIVFDSPSVLGRFEDAGVLDRVAAEDLGIVGPAARASGCDRDVRRDHPAGIHRFALVPVAMVEAGDVMSRALVRWLEVQRSLQFVREQLRMRHSQGASALACDVPPPPPSSVAVAMVEGWRGEIVHASVTDADGRVAGYSVVDPSVHNWFGLAFAMRDNPISDFPLCNKSFNLSYAGHDL
ncbi:MAG: NADH-quinone oxidoreductase subunit C [Candidatus Wallbacteria bacterium]|nr:NADH-quinone oxidoreductase subunit C [Candidatus Wallbacteria bacterium]